MGSQRDANGPGAIFCNEIRNHLSLYSNKNSPGTKTFFQLQLTPLTFFWVGKTRKGHFEGGELRRRRIFNVNEENYFSFDSARSARVNLDGLKAIKCK